MYNKSDNIIIVSNNNTKRMKTTGKVTAYSLLVGQHSSISDQHLQSGAPPLILLLDIAMHTMVSGAKTEF